MCTSIYNSLASYHFIIILKFLFLNFPQLQFIQVIISKHLNMPGIGLSARSIQVDKCDKWYDGTIYKIKVVSNEEVVNEMGKVFESRRS